MNEEHKEEQEEKAPGIRALSWVLRILLIVVGLFLALFSFDVFGDGYSFWKTVLAFLIHNIPTFAIFAVVAIAWRWEHIAGLILIFFALLGTFPLGPLSNKNLFLYILLVVIALVGILLILNYAVFGRKLKFRKRS